MLSESIVCIKLLWEDEDIIRDIARLEIGNLNGSGGREKRYYVRMAIPP